MVLGSQKKRERHTSSKETCLSWFDIPNYADGHWVGFDTNLCKDGYEQTFIYYYKTLIFVFMIIYNN